jgi:hypothetical protein
MRRFDQAGVSVNVTLAGFAAFAALHKALEANLSQKGRTCFF